MFYSHKHQGLGYLEFNTDGSTVIAEEDDGLRHDAGNMLMIPDPFIETVDVGIGEVPVASIARCKVCSRQWVRPQLEHEAWAGTQLTRFIAAPLDRLLVTHDVLAQDGQRVRRRWCVHPARLH